MNSQNHHDEILVCKIMQATRINQVARGSMIKAIAALNKELNKTTFHLLTENPNHPYLASLAAEVRERFERKRCDNEEKIMNLFSSKWKKRYIRFLNWLLRKVNIRRNRILLEFLKSENPVV